MGSFRDLGGVFIPTSTGGITLQITAEPDPVDIQLELLRIDYELEQLEIPLLGARRVLMDEMKIGFETESDPDGNKWFALDVEYLANKVSLGYPETILHREGALETAATSEDAFIIEDDTIFFDTSVLPTTDEGTSYGLLHQTGTTEAPGGIEATSNVGIASIHRRRSSSDSDYRAQMGGPHSNQGIGRGKALPPRPFIGMSALAEAEIEAVFDVWFEGVTETEEGGFKSSTAYIRSSGVAQHRVSGPGFGGRFGKKIL